MGAYALEISGTAFGQSRELFESMISWLAGQQAQGLAHAELQTRLQAEGRQLSGQLTQDHLDLRAQQESRLKQVVGADGARRARAETGRTRSQATVFGPVTVQRITHRQPGHASVHPADGVLNLPAKKHSHRLRRLATPDRARGSFADATETIARLSGQQ